MKRLRPTALLITFLLSSILHGYAGETPDWQWGGSLRSLNLTGETAPSKLLPAYHLSSTRLRLETSWQGQNGWQLEAAGDHQLLGTDPSGSVPLPGDGVNRRVDLDHSWQHDAGWASRLQVDRLNLAWSTGSFDAAIGRQAIGFGRIVIFSPLDIIAPFPPDAIDTEVRPGVDAMRGTVHYGQDGQLGAVAVFGDEQRHNSYLLTWSDNRARVDLLGLAGELRSRPVLGLGLAGSVGTLGLKAEVTGYHGTRVGEAGGDRNRHFAIAALEGWYRFNNGLTLLVEYLYNGSGSGDPADYPLVAVAAPAREGLATLLGRDYLLIAPSLELHPLVTLNGLLIWNLGDDSFLLRPALSLSLTDNLALELFWTVTQGSAPHRQRFPRPPLIRSEFGSQGDSGGLFLTWYF